MTKAEFHRDLTAMTHQLLGDEQPFHDLVREGLPTNLPRLPRSPFLNSARRLQPHPEWAAARP